MLKHVVSNIIFMCERFFSDVIILLVFTQFKIPEKYFNIFIDTNIHLVIMFHHTHTKLCIRYYYYSDDSFLLANTTMIIVTITPMYDNIHQFVFLHKFL